MEIRITARELLDRGLWMEYCDICGINEWAISEGLMDADERLLITEEQAKQIGLIG